MSITDSHTANLVRWDPTRPGVYESHFFKANLPEEQLALWWRFTILHSRSAAPVFQLWSIVFDLSPAGRSFAVRESFTPAQVRIDRETLETRYGVSTLRHGASEGRLDRAGHTVEWDLQWTIPEHAFHHFPYPAMYTGAVPKTKLSSPVLDGRFSGQVVLDGRRVSFQEAPGMQGHNWGTKNADHWVWVHCNAFRGAPGAVFEAVSSRIALGPVDSPQLTILHFEDAGRRTTINGPAELVRAQSRLDGLTWRFRNHRGDAGLEGWFGAEADRFVGLPYDNPDGPGVTCLNSKVASGELRLLTRVGGVWRLERVLEADSVAAVEIGTRGDTAGVPVTDLEPAWVPS